jgi:hypothetical protein
VALTKVLDFNQIVEIDLKQFGNKEVLWMICSFTRFCQGIVLKDKSGPTIIEAINSLWCWRFGFPSVSFWADNGPEFKNGELEEYASKAGFTIKFGPNYLPWCNGLNERNHYSVDMTVKKIMEVDKKLTLQKAVEMAAWTHNTNTNVLGYDLMSLVTGKSVIIPGISNANVATDSVIDSEAIRLIMKRHMEIMKKFWEVEYSAKLKRASEQRNRKFNDIQYKENDWVFFIKIERRRHGMVQSVCFDIEVVLFFVGEWRFKESGKF